MATPTERALLDVERLSDLFPILQPTENGVTAIYTYDEHFASIPGIVSPRPSAE